MELVILESPYAGDVKLNVQYARACVRDCIVNHQQAPMASHLLYTQDGILDDDDKTERTLGINAGLAWGRAAEKTIVYTDLGTSPGMRWGIQRAMQEGRAIEYRSLKAWSGMLETLRRRSKYKLIATIVLGIALLLGGAYGVKKIVEAEHNFSEHFFDSIVNT